MVLDNRPTTSLRKVVDRVVEEYMASLGYTAFDKRQLELRILGTPEFRRIHDVQVEYLQDLDLEEAVMDFMHRRVQRTLQDYSGKNGKRAVLAVPTRGVGRKEWTWYVLDMMPLPMIDALIMECEQALAAYGSKLRSLKKIRAAMQDKGTDAVAGDVLDVLDAEERDALRHVTMRLPFEDGDGEEN